MDERTKAERDESMRAYKADVEKRKAEAAGWTTRGELLGEIAARMGVSIEEARAAVSKIRTDQVLRSAADLVRMTESIIREDQGKGGADG